MRYLIFVSLFGLSFLPASSAHSAICEEDDSELAALSASDFSSGTPRSTPLRFTPRASPLVLPASSPYQKSPSRLGVHKRNLARAISGIIFDNLDGVLAGHPLEMEVVDFYEAAMLQIASDPLCGVRYVSLLGTALEDALSPFSTAANLQLRLAESIDKAVQLAMANEFRRLLLALNKARRCRFSCWQEREAISAFLAATEPRAQCFLGGLLDYMKTWRESKATSCDLQDIPLEEWKEIAEQIRAFCAKSSARASKIVSFDPFATEAPLWHAEST